MGSGDLQGTPLIRAKLHAPTLPSQYIRRRKLNALLQASVNRKLVLLLAPTGCGKTALLGDWCRHAKQSGDPVKTAWYVIDDGDNDPGRFWSYILGALNTLRPGAYDALASRLPQAGSSGNAFAVALGNWLYDTIPADQAEPAKYVLILDNYHHVTSDDIHASLVSFMDSMPSCIHLFIATRETPPLALDALRSKGQLLEVPPKDMMLDIDETRTFLKDVMGLPVSAEEVEALQDEFGGWVAGLQFYVADQIGHSRNAARYIEDICKREVLDRLPERTQRFLMETSIFERFNAPLCDWVRGADDSQEIIEELERGNLVVYDFVDDRYWYRTSKPLRTFLARQLRETLPERFSKLHGLASVWLERNGLKHAAAEHALASDDIECIIRLIRAVGSLSSYCRAEDLHDWLQKTPEETIASHPELALLAAWSYLDMAEQRDCEKWLAAAERFPGSDARDLQEAAIRAALPSPHGKYRESMEQCAHMLDVLRADERQDACLLSETLAHAGVACESTGQLDKAERLLTEARVIADEYDFSATSATTSFELAVVHFLRGDIRQAADQLELVLKEHPDDRFVTGGAHCGLGRIEMERNRLDKAASHIERAINTLPTYGNTDLLLKAHITQVDLLLIQGRTSEASERMFKVALMARNGTIARSMALSVPIGQANIALAVEDLDAAEDIVGENDVKFEAADANNDYRWQLIKARLTIARGTPAEALEALRELEARARNQGMRGFLIETLLLEAACLLETGHRADARAHLVEALELAEPQGYIRTFVACGSSVGTLLYDMLHDHSAQGPRSAYIRRLLNAFAESGPRVAGAPRRSAARPPIGTLTDREMEILQLLNRGMSRIDVSKHLMISENTTKTHLARIYSKMGVQNRSDLFRVSLENGLSSTAVVWTHNPSLARLLPSDGTHTGAATRHGSWRTAMWRSQ